MQTSHPTLTIEHGDVPRSEAPSRWLIIADDGPSQTKVVPLRDSLLVGRDTSCQLVLSSQGVSRRHARFECHGKSLRVIDLGSRNGLTMSGRRVREATLSHRDCIVVGGVPITVQTLERGGPIAAPPQLPRMVPSGPMAELEDMTRRVACRDLSVLVLGETGAGKERVARALHAQSARRQGPLHVVNCGAIPATLLESFLFGHERGAFTGAERPRAGLFEEARGGTVFLDEVAELSAAAQAALLRVLESRMVARLGSLEERAVDVRIVAATHRPLDELVARGEFRRDLYHRLNAVTLVVPPLRARRAEIAQLAQQFLHDAAALWRVAVPSVEPAVWTRLESYAWPGNVRELRNVVERALALCDEPTLSSRHLPDHVTGRSHEAPQPTPDPPDWKRRAREQELEQVRRALAESGGRKAEAADSLGMPLRTFRRRLRELEQRT